ncbi:hypothetical protein [Burkholderia gladioli]|uniref:hypothetical protein n=1 Tax=Burkholderia gladioli TaxID=28095 RepID=UPI001641893E|nr:hypothetical protein [Burkholderia gladioli]
MSESKQKWTPGPWTLTTVPTSVGICHKIGPFPPSRDGGKPRHACLYADYPSDSNPADQELLTNAKLISAAPDLERAARIQHRVIDMLLARLIELDPSFMPTKSNVWPLIVEADAVAALAKAEA